MRQRGIEGPNLDTGSMYRFRMHNVGVSAMYQMLRLTIVAMAAAFASFPTSAPAQVTPTQIKLTEKNVEGFIAAQKDMSALAEKMQSAVLSNHADAKHKAELEAVARKNGFKNFAEYETVAANISMVMTTIDPQTKEFTDPQAAIRKELEDVNADKTIVSNEKKKLINELNEALKSAQSIQFPTNIELVTKYYDKIDVTTIAAYDGDGSPTSSVVRTISE
jgi:post-segregation antitoxin (ccd killing protein)